MKIARRIAALEQSVTLAVTAKARQMKASGIDVVGFGAGEPDFDTPEHIKLAAAKAVDKGETKYGPAAGTLELREAIVEKTERENGLRYKTAEVIACSGAKHALYNAILTLVEPGDRVLLPSPYWVSYPEQIKCAGGVAVPLPCDQEHDFKLTPDALERALKDGASGIILNSPSNPTGTVYDPHELKALGEVLANTDLFVISDEIYEKLVYDGAEHASIAALVPALRDRTVVMNGVSKAYAMTGWRVGWATGPAEVIDLMVRLQSHSTSGPATMAQAAAVAALRGDQSSVSEMAAQFDRRRKYMVDRLRDMPGIKCELPLGAFYVFARIDALYGKSFGEARVSGSLFFCNAALEQARVALVPGVAFGDDRFIRLSYATGMEAIEKGMDRLKEFVSRAR